MDKCAENCEAIRQEVEAFKTFVPLVQVWGQVWGVGAGVTLGRPLCKMSTCSTCAVHDPLC